MNEIADHEVIERMRAALDEASRGLGDEAAAEIAAVTPLGPSTMRSRRWVGVAAATLLVSGGAVWALAQREPTTPASSPVTTLAAPVNSTAPTEAPTATTTAVVVAAVEPWFTLQSPDLVPGEIFRRDAVPIDQRDLVQSWSVTSSAGRGFLVATIRDEVDPGVEGDYTTELLPVDDGVAYLLIPNGPDGPLDHGFEVRWFHDDGTAWFFQSQGLEPDVLGSLALGALPGSGLPIVIADESVTVISVGAFTGEAVIQDYANATGTVRLQVVPDGSALAGLISAANIVDVTVAGMPGYAASLDNGQINVAWDAGGGWWGSLLIGPPLARAADGIIAGVVASD
jgi:hypothetical protein